MNTLHLIRDGGADIAQAVIDAQIVQGAEVSVVYLGSAPGRPFACPRYRLEGAVDGEESIDWDGVLDCVVQADKTVTW